MYDRFSVAELELSPLFMYEENIHIHLLVSAAKCGLGSPASIIEFFSNFDLLKIKVASLWVWPIVKFRALWGLPW